MPALFETVLATLLEMSLVAAFVAAVVILLRLVLKKRAPKQIICLLWLLVFARLLIPVAVESPVSLVPSVLEEVVSGQAEQEESPAVPNAGITVPGFVDEIPAMPVTSGSPVLEDVPVLETPSGEEAPLGEAPQEEEPVDETPGGNIPPAWARVIPVVWLAGVAAMLVMGVGSYAKLRRRVYDSIRTEDDVWEHPSLASPFILGLFRPRIYLPMGISGAPRQFILQHERAHLRRLDHVVKPICWLALAIHWFNPLAWVAFLLMSRDIETACDESVIRRLGSEVKADYSATLLALATGKRFPAPSPLSFGEGDAKVRIKNVLSFKKPALWVSVAAVIAAVVAAVCLLTDPVTPDAPDLSGYTTREEYPGLYFLEEPSSTAGTKITAYKLVDGELVLVGGYDEHLANNFSGLIGPDGEEELLFLGLDEIYAMFEELLAEACREMDPDWIPPDKAEIELGELLYEDGLIALYETNNGRDTVLTYGDYTQTLDGFGFNDMRPYCTTWEADADGDGTKELYIIHPFGSGTGVSVDTLTVCEPNGDKLDVWYHDPTDIQSEFNENRIATYYPDSQSIEITYGNATHILVIDDATIPAEYMPGVMELAFINGNQIAYSPDDDGTVTLTFVLSLAGENIPMLTYIPVKVSCVIRFNGNGFVLADGLRFFREKEPNRLISSLPGEGVYLYVDGKGDLILQDGERIGPVLYVNDINDTHPGYFDLSKAELIRKEIQQNQGGDVAVILINTPDAYGVANGRYQWAEELGAWELAPVVNPLASLPFEIVTSDTLPSDPEEYYLVAELPEELLWLYARNHGQDSMLMWGNTFWWPLEGRVAHTGHMDLPEMTMLGENTVAVVSEVNTGTQTGVDQLVVYELLEDNVVGSSHYQGLGEYVYNWQTIAAQFNRDNTLVYDKETNSFTLTLGGSGKTYATGTLAEDVSISLGLEDGFTGAAIATGQIVRYRINEDKTITVTMQTGVGRGGQGEFDEEGFWSWADEDNRYYPSSVGVTGIELSWDIKFQDGKFYVYPFSIGCAGLEVISQ